MEKKNNIENQAPEIRAFIYQQLSDLEPLMPTGTAVSVLVEDPALADKTLKDPAKKVVIQLETSAGNLVVESANKDVYAAIASAKNDLETQLSTLQNIWGGDERNDQIDDIIEHRYLH